jgi:hypothetical protein
MYPVIAGIFFSLVLTFFDVRVSVAGIWECTQSNGSTLYTDEPQGERSCEKVELGNRVILLPPRIEPSLPPADTTYHEQEAYAPEVQAKSRVEEQVGAPSGFPENYRPQPDSFWSWGESPVYVYTYVAPFYGIPSSRHARPRDVWSHTRTQLGFRDNIPLLRQPSSLTPSRRPRENSAHSEVSTTLQLAPPVPPKYVREKSTRAGAQTTEPHSFSPPSSMHARRGLVGAADAAAPAPFSSFSPHMKR